MEEKETQNAMGFAKKIWIAGSIIAFIIIILLLIKATFSVLLLVFAGALIALYFRGLGNLIHRKLRIKPPWSLISGVVITLLLLSGFIILAGARISEQTDNLSRILPETIDTFKQQINESKIGKQIWQRISSGNQTQKLGAAVQTFFRSSFGILWDVYVVLFLGIFFTAAPKVYLRGFRKLIPSKAKPKADEIISTIGANLKKWLKGKLLAMLIVAILTLAGLLIIGIPMAFTLSIIAGILNFIPNFGPVIALIPAVLVGLSEGPVTVLLVAGLYILVQVLESNFITPQIQKKLVSIPPALIIIAQLLMGVLTGGWGLLLATPLILIVMIVVNELYVSKMANHE